MSATRQSASNSASKKRKLKVATRERTVTTLTGSDEFLDNGHGRDRLGPPLSNHGSVEEIMSTSFSKLPSSGGDHFGSQSMQHNLHGPGADSHMSGIDGPFSQQAALQHSQQALPFRNQHVLPGQGDLELLERLKQTIKDGQHEIYRAFPNPAALAGFYNGSIDLGLLCLSGSSKQSVPPHEEHETTPSATENIKTPPLQPSALAPTATLPINFSRPVSRSSSPPLRSGSGTLDSTRTQPTASFTHPQGSDAAVSHQSAPAGRQIEEPLDIKPDIRALESHSKEQPPSVSDTSTSSALDAPPATVTSARLSDSKTPPTPTTSNMANSNDKPAATFAHRQREYERSAYPSPPHRPVSSYGQSPPKSYERESTRSFEQPRDWNHDKRIEHSRDSSRHRSGEDLSRRPTLESRIFEPNPQWDSRIYPSKTEPVQSNAPFASSGRSTLGARSFEERRVRPDGQYSAPASRRSPPPITEGRSLLEERRPASFDRRPIFEERRPVSDDRRPIPEERPLQEERRSLFDDRRSLNGSASQSLQSTPRSVPAVSNSIPETASRAIIPATSTGIASSEKPPVRVPTLQERISGAPPLLPHISDAPRSLPPRVAALEDRLSSRAIDNRPRTFSSSDIRPVDEGAQHRPADAPKATLERVTPPTNRDNRRVIAPAVLDDRRPPVDHDTRRQPTSATSERFPPPSDTRPRTANSSFSQPVSHGIHPSSEAPLPSHSSSRPPPPAEYRSSGLPREASSDRKGYYERPVPAETGRVSGDFRFPPAPVAEKYESGAPRLDNIPRTSVHSSSPGYTERTYRTEPPRHRDDLDKERGRDWYPRTYDDRARAAPRSPPPPAPAASAPYWEEKDRRPPSSQIPTRSAASWDREPYSAGPPAYNAGSTGRVDDRDRDRDVDRGRPRERERVPSSSSSASRDPYYTSYSAGYESRPPPPPPPPPVARDPYPTPYTYDDRTRPRLRSRSPVDDRQPPYKRPREDGYDAIPGYYAREKEPPPPHVERGSYSERDYYPPYDAGRRTPPVSYRR